MINTIHSIAKNIEFVRKNLDFVMKVANIKPQIEAKARHYAVGTAFLIVAIFMIPVAILFFLLYLFFIITNLDNLTVPSLIFSGGSLALSLILSAIGIHQLKK